MRRAPSVSARRRDACSRASACRATWASRTAPSRTCASSKSTFPATLLLISGAIPGSEGGRVIVKPSIKAAGQARRKKLMPNKAPVAAKGAPAQGRPRCEGRGTQGRQEVNPHEAPAKERISSQRYPIVGCCFRPCLQRSARAPGRHRLHGGRPCRHQGAENARGSARRRQEAVEPERYGPGPCRLDSQPHLGGRRTGLRSPAARFLAEGQSQDVSRRHAIHGVRIGPPGSAGRGRIPGARRAQNEAPDQQVGGVWS